MRAGVVDAGAGRRPDAAGRRRALLTPGSLAIIGTTFAAGDRSQAIGALGLPGATAAAIGLAGATYALIGMGEGDVGTEVVIGGVAGILQLVWFVVQERRAAGPMVPPVLLCNRQFVAANLVTVTVYAALGVMFLLFVVYLQQVLAYSPIEAGLATIPATLLLLFLSSRSGALADRIGPSLQMTVGR